MLGIADPLIMTPLADMRQQRLRYERIVARTLDLAQQIPAGAARVTGIENDVAVFEKAGHGFPIGIGGDMSIAAPYRTDHHHLPRGRIAFTSVVDRHATTTHVIPVAANV